MEVGTVGGGLVAARRRRRPLTGTRLEARVELDDQLLVDRGIHLFARGQAIDDCLEVLGVEREPAGDVAHPVLLEIAGRDLAGARRVLDLNFLAGTDVVARDVDLVAIHTDMAVVDHLAGGSAALGESEQIDHAIEAGLKQLQETLTGDTALALGDLEDATELALEQTVDVTELLLLVQTDGILGELAAVFRAVLAGGKDDARTPWSRRKSADRNDDSCGW